MISVMPAGCFKPASVISLRVIKAEVVELCELREMCEAVVGGGC